MKQCKKCLEEKLLSEFWKLARSSDGHNSKCAECMRKETRKYQSKWREARPKAPQGQKICSKCKETKDLDQFAWAADRSDYRQGYCKSCKSKNYHKNGKSVVINRTRENRRKIQIVSDQYKIDAGCKYCGYNRCAPALHFHHRDPSQKDFNISSAVTRNLSIKRVLDEMAKCDVLCSIHHTELHEGVLEE